MAEDVGNDIPVPGSEKYRRQEVACALAVAVSRTVVSGLAEGYGFAEAKIGLADRGVEAAD